MPGAVEVTYNFGSGYTWFSVNANPGNWNVNTVFNGLSPSDNDRIIGQTNFAVYYAAGNQWVGSLSTIDPKKMYIMKLTTGQAFNLTGLPVNPQLNQISLNPGYTWIGYLPKTSMAINTALGNMSVGPSSNDRFIGQSQFAVFDGGSGQWIGSLLNLDPGDGYKIKLTNATVLTYPSNSSSYNNLNERLAKTQSPPVWVPAQNQQYNMQIVGEIVWNGQVSANSNDMIGAFVGSECRGVAMPTGAGPYPNIFFLTVTSNQSSGELVTFKVYHAGLDQVDENPSYSAVTFVNQSELGTLSNPFTVNSPLPVELTSFTADVNGNLVNLHWETATEVNNYGFEIERKGLDNWEKIGFVQGNGNSNSPKSYSFSDKNLVGGTKFQYRLKQIDVDGKFQYSNAVEIEAIPNKFELMQNYPNPFNPRTTIRFSVPTVTELKINVYSVLGEKVLTAVEGKFEPGFYQTEVNAGNLPSGIYIYRLESKDYIQTKKMMLLK